MMLTVPTAMLGELVSARATVNYETLPSEGLGQATLDVHLEGEADTITLELGAMPEAAERAASILRTLADELEHEAESYTYVPEQWDGFVGLDRGQWGASLDGKGIDLPRGVSEEGAVVALALACREDGYYPNLWVDRYGRGGDDAITPETLANAAAEVLDVTEWEEPHCDHCEEPITRTDEGWTHPEVPERYGHLTAAPSPVCHVYGGWELEDGEEETVATPYRELDEADVRAVLDEVAP